MSRAVKTAVFVAIVVVSNTVGNLFLSLGMKQPGAGPLAALLNPWVLAGIALLIVWTFSRMALLSWADLSFVLPVTSLGYVLNAILGLVVHGERITTERWLGTLLIVAGTALAGSTPPDSRRA
ncbi:MAG: hypothetical protein FJW39_02190 [Acidobacteria bacterium]|nr:hypothetical protein [Acidobacteriota bacterium]